MINVRPIKVKDVDACYKIVRANFTSEVAGRFLDEIGQLWTDMSFPPIYYVAEMDNAVVGFAGMIESWLLYRVWDFVWINVNKDYQKAGVGKALMEHRINEVIRCDGRTIHLMSRHPAYFEKFGFTVSKDYGAWKFMHRQLGIVEL